MVVTDTLYRGHPDLAEGKLAKLRASVVNMRALAGVARTHRPGRPRRVPAARPRRGGHRRPGQGQSILADTLEAVLGAVYLEHGLDERDPGDPPAVRHAARRRRPPRGAGLDWKTSLQELTAEHGLGVPEYVMTADGPDHAKTFTARRTSPGELFAASTGRNKKEAEQAAAEAAWRAISGRLGRPGAELTRRRAEPVPELPEVETVRAGLDRWVAGRTVAAVEVAAPAGRPPAPGRRRRLRRPPDRAHASPAGPARQVPVAAAARSDGARGLRWSATSA